MVTDICRRAERRRGKRVQSAGGVRPQGAVMLTCWGSAREGRRPFPLESDRGEGVTWPTEASIGAGCCGFHSRPPVALRA